ncbi:MAG: T9SS type A sorting domain-containing protein [Bacteroidales bacterium]|nr:T9SS type A sorting domain-containing protein [Bacteroidales bacterium]
MKGFYSLCFTVILFTSFNVMAQWIQHPSAPTGYINDIVTQQDTIYLGHANQGIYQSKDNGITWVQLNNGLISTQAKQISQLLVKGDTIFAATTDGIYRSLDKGENWQKKSTGIFVGNGAIYAFAKSIYKHEGILITGAFTGIYRSSDWGETWEESNITGAHVYPQHIINHNGILFAARESINTPYGYQSTDGGITWTDMTIGQPTICFMSEPGKLWCGTIHGMWLSENDGATWENRSEGLPPDPYNAGIVRVGDQLISSLKFGGSGIYHSFDEGQNWENFGGGLTFMNIIGELVVQEGRILAISSNGLWEREIETTGDQEITISSAAIHNFPNPFHNKTQFHFKITQPCFVHLEILDEQGIVVRTVVHQNLRKGNYTLSWDGNKDSGREARPGMYYYRFTKNNSSETGKLLKIQY